MNDYDIEAIKITIVYEDGSKRVLNSGSLSDEALDALYQEIDQYLQDESFNYNVEAEWKI